MRGILTALTVAIMIGAILVYVSAGDIPKSVGNDYHGVKARHLMRSQVLLSGRDRGIHVRCY